MQSNGTIKGLIGYNVQSAVDTKHHLIVAHDVTNNGSDRSQLSKISRMSKEAMHVDKLSVVADRGYYKGKEIQSCDDAGISAYVCRPQTSGSQATGLYGKRDFIYVPNEDLYICPAGEKAIYRYTTTEKGLSVKKYWSSACVRCLIKSDCTTGVNRRITRTEYEPALEVMATRLDEKPEVMAIRKSTVEHPFGTIKMWMGSTHFLMKRLSCVSAEMSLHVLAYNLTRVMNMIGSKQLIKAIQA
ncbi:MAG: transposase [Methylococcales bacterium]|nr:transposase [Methylococcales bacterium]MBT7446033.1 transposase [Methylococcales bacterium]